MGKHLRKVEKKLASRIESYEDVPSNAKKAYTRPGSQNLKKQAGGVNRRGR